jgi:hypothetical protein
VPGTPGSLSFYNQDLTARSGITVTCFDANGAVTTDPAVAVKTFVDYEPAFDYEALGGWIDIAPNVVGSTPGQHILAVTGVPDIPFAYGGSVPFVYPVDLALVYTSRVVSDGRASQYLVYDPVYHTNKMRWTFWHETSNPHRYQVYLETFAE